MLTCDGAALHRLLLLMAIMEAVGESVLSSAGMGQSHSTESLQTSRASECLRQHSALAFVLHPAPAFVLHPAPAFIPHCTSFSAFCQNQGTAQHIAQPLQNLCLIKYVMCVYAHPWNILRIHIRSLDKSNDTSRTTKIYLHRPCQSSLADILNCHILTTSEDKK